MEPKSAGINKLARRSPKLGQDPGGSVVNKT